MYEKLDIQNSQSKIRNNLVENPGAVEVRIKELAEARGLSLYRVAKLADLDYSTVHKLANSQTTGIQFDKLATLCQVLECEPGDLLCYSPQE